ncbi:hypothetical protein BGZ96_010895 [Linnemannia gamsii]|uniref:Methyl-accepting transducer domain-containing protein n=1 Tax=Linnemannia gamsii TaxID=64522 RepID=A0ABQ7JTI9_9FUNG|nr:hypothetical protein BGZ96_010895 [Linnemannia gamsii]
MTSDLKYHARQAIDSLYDFLFNAPAYDPSIQAGSCCIKPYHGENGAANPGSFLGSVTGDGGRAGRLASAVQDKVGLVASSASSAAASLVSTIGSGGGENDGSHSIGRHHQHHGGAGGWHSTSSDSTFSHWQSVLINYWHSLSGPDFWHQLQYRLGIDDLARSWSLEPHIIFLLLLLPLVLLLLSSCLMLGAGNTSEEPHAPRRKSDPTKVVVKGSQGSSSYASVVASGSSSTSNAGKSKKIQGPKKGGAQDDVGSIASENQLGNNHGISSWSALLGSTGFLGGEFLGYKPIDIYAAMKSAEKRIVDSAKDVSAPGHDDGIVSNIIEEIVGPTETQHEQKEIGLDNKEEYIDNVPTSDQHNVNQIDKGRASRSGPVGLDGSASNSSSAKIRVPRPYGAKEADRHRHQPHMSFRNLAPKSAPHQGPQSSFAAKVMDFAQENPVMKNLDGISGGVLGAAMATVAALANTAQAATTSLKEGMPTSVDEFTNDLRSSFDKAMEEGGLEGSGFDKQDEQSSVTSDSIRAKAESSRTGSSSSSNPAMENSGENFSKGLTVTANSQAHSTSSTQSAKENIGEALPKGPAMVANPPRLRKRSVVQSQPGTAANIATATATAPIPPSDSTSPPSSSDSTHKAAASASTVKSAPTASKMSVPTSYKAALSSNLVNATSASKSAKEVTTRSENQKSDLPAPVKKDDVNIVATKAAHGTKKATGDVVDDAKDVAASAVDDPKDSVEGAKGAASDAVKGTKGAVGAATSKANKRRRAAVKKANEAAKKAKETIDAASQNANELKDVAVDKANKLKNTAVNKRNEGVEQAKDDIGKNIVRSTKNADRRVEGAVKDAEKKAEVVVNNVSKITKEANGAAVQKASEAVKEAKDVIATTAEEGNKLKDAVIEKASDSVEQTKEVIDKNVVQPLKDAEKKIEGSVKSAEKRFEGAVENATKSAYKAKDVVVQKAGLATQVAAETVKDVEKRAEDVIKDNSKIAHKAKDVTVQNAGKVALVAVDTVKSAEKVVESAVKNAAETAYKAKDTAVEMAGEVAHVTVNAVEDAEKRAENATKSAAEIVEAKDAVVEKSGEMTHAAAATVRDAERQLEDTITGEPYAEDSFDDGSLIDADEDQSLDEMDEDTPSYSVHFDSAARKTDIAAAATTTAQPPVAISPAHNRSASPSEKAQNAMHEAADELADVAESLSSMFAGFKDSVTRALKDVKDMASHVGPALAPASTSVSTAHATGHLETSPTSSSSHVFKQQGGSKRKSIEAHAAQAHVAQAHTAAASSTDAPQHKDDSKKPDGRHDGRSYRDVVKVSPASTPKLAAAKLPGGFPADPAAVADDNSVHPHDDALASFSSDDHTDAPPTKIQELTVDESGNKVPMVDARRDSGFDLLM